jgi:hypothetical protein
LARQLNVIYLLMKIRTEDFRSMAPKVDNDFLSPWFEYNKILA